jgi:hypothetical protein
MCGLMGKSYVIPNRQGGEASVIIARSDILAPGYWLGLRLTAHTSTATTSGTKDEESVNDPLPRDKGGTGLVRTIKQNLGMCFPHHGQVVSDEETLGRTSCDDVYWKSVTPAVDLFSSFVIGLDAIFARLV